MSIEQSFERIAAALERLAFVANEFLVAAGGRATAAPSDLPGLTVAQAEARPAPPTAVATVGALPQQASEGPDHRTDAPGCDTGSCSSCDGSRSGCGTGYAGGVFPYRPDR